MKLPRRIKVTDCKLKNHAAAGLTLKGVADEFLIDPRLDENHRLEILLHEGQHLLMPDVSEMLIRAYSRRLKDMLWRDGWRRIKG